MKIILASKIGVRKKILDNHNIKKIDVLIVNFYPFEKVIKSNKYICLESSYKNENGQCEDITAFLEKQNYTLIDCDWPNTKNGNLPNKDVVNKNQFCLLYENTHF